MPCGDDFQKKSLKVYVSNYNPTYPYAPLTSSYHVVNVNQNEKQKILFIYTIPFIFHIVEFSFLKIISLLSCWNATRVCITGNNLHSIYCIMLLKCVNNVFGLNE